MASKERFYLSTKEHPRLWLRDSHAIKKSIDLRVAEDTNHILYLSVPAKTSAKVKERK